MLERRHVDIDRGSVQGKRLAFDAQRWGRDAAEALPQDDERVTETITRVLICSLPPEDSGELVTFVGFSRAQREISQQRLRLLGRHVDHTARGEPHVEATEERQPEGDHQRIANTEVIRL
jgi:hypothetical protein